MACAGCQARRQAIVAVAKRVVAALKPRPPVDEHKGSNVGRKLIQGGWQRRK